MHHLHTATRRAHRGFTILEVLIATLVLTIGMIGIFGMQTIAIQANRVAYDTRVATELAETTLERISRDAIEWTGAGNWRSAGYLAQGMSTTGAWVAPPVAGYTGSQSLTYNDLGVPQYPSMSPSNARLAERNSRYCLDYRIDWVRAPRLARVQVRVTWPRTVAGEAILQENCANLATIDDDVRTLNFQSVQATTMVASNAVLQ